MRITFPWSVLHFCSPCLLLYLLCLLSWSLTHDWTSEAFRNRRPGHPITSFFMEPRPSFVLNQTCLADPLPFWTPHLFLSSLQKWSAFRLDPFYFVCKVKCISNLKPCIIKHKLGFYCFCLQNVSSFCYCNWCLTYGIQ